MRFMQCYSWNEYDYMSLQKFKLEKKYKFLYLK